MTSKPSTKWYHGSPNNFSEIDKDRLRKGDYGEGLYLTSDLSLAYSYSKGAYIYQVTLSKPPVTTGEKIKMLVEAKGQSDSERMAIKRLPLLELNDDRGEICIVKDLECVVELKQLDIQVVERYLKRRAASHESDPGMMP
ncbi:hypothetical protein [Vibrio owensii]|uniref:hypothetical protein n=1 Tax=Vibrio owensii TaxID=696485 RepID=UPI003CC6AE2A